jgi:hypothetical protein
VQAGTDSIPFIYLKNGNKQIVVLGESNENNVVIDQGLKEGTQVYLSTPADVEKFKLYGEDLIPVIKEIEKAKKAEELRQREESEKLRKQREVMTGGERGMNVTPEMMQQYKKMRGSGQTGRRDTSAGRRQMIPPGQPGTKQK